MKSQGVQLGDLIAAISLRSWLRIVTIGFDERQLHFPPPVPQTRAEQSWGVAPPVGESFVEFASPVCYKTEMRGRVDRLAGPSGRSMAQTRPGEALSRAIDAQSVL